MVRFLGITVILASAATILTGVSASAPTTYPANVVTSATIGSADRPFLLPKVTVTASPLPNTATPGPDPV